MSCFSVSHKWLAMIAVLVMLTGCDQIAQQIESANEPDPVAAEPVVADSVTETPTPVPAPTPEPTLPEPEPQPAPKKLPTLEELVDYSTSAKRSGKTRGVNFSLNVKLTGDDLGDYAYFVEVKDASGGEQVWPMEYSDSTISLEKFVPNAGSNDKYMFHIKYGHKEAGGGGYLQGHKPEVFQSGRK